MLQDNPISQVIIEAKVSGEGFLEFAKTQMDHFVNIHLKYKWNQFDIAKCSQDIS